MSKSNFEKNVFMTPPTLSFLLLYCIYLWHRFSFSEPRSALIVIYWARKCAQRRTRAHNSICSAKQKTSALIYWYSCSSVCLSCTSEKGLLMPILVTWERQISLLNLLQFISDDTTILIIALERNIPRIRHHFGSLGSFSSPAFRIMVWLGNTTQSQCWNSFLPDVEQTPLSWGLWYVRQNFKLI